MISSSIVLGGSTTSALNATRPQRGTNTPLLPIWAVARPYMTCVGNFEHTFTHMHMMLLSALGLLYIAATHHTSPTTRAYSASLALTPRAWTNRCEYFHLDSPFTFFD
jgi:hypothetical protein